MSQTPRIYDEDEFESKQCHECGTEKSNVVALKTHKIKEHGPGAVNGK
jgi:hypothetical protein